MNREILNKCRFLLLSLALPFVGCSKEQLVGVNDGTEGNPVEVRLSVGAQSASSVLSNETDINRLRVVVFGSSGSSDAGRLILNKFYAKAPADNSFKEMITAGRRDIFILVNEPLSGSGAELESYKSIASVNDIRSLSLIYGGAGSLAVYTPSEVPMFISHSSKLISPDSSNEISEEVAERVMAKVTMKLNVKHSNFPSGKHVVIDNITIKNLPETSSWIAQNYAGALTTSEKQNIQVVTSVVDYNVSSNNTFYVPEYILANADEGAYIEISGHINGEASRVCKYIVKLGDAMDDGGTYGNRYDITRNRHYIFTGDVKTYGEINDLAVKVTVLPWNTVNMEEEIGRYVSFVKVTNASNVVIADGSNLNDMGETIKVSCETNIGGWYVVVRNAKGNLVYTSAPTADVTTRTEQTVDVVVPSAGGVTYMQSYTISVYHSAIANEDVGPVKVMNFTQFGGIVPSSVLVAAGWSTDRLPATGLQLAMRGDNVLPGGTPAADDPAIVWSAEGIATGITEAGLGKGKGNYALLAAKDAGQYPIGQACQHLGPEWYVPSIAELKLIHTNKPLLGASYTFTANNYWSATEDSSGSSWIVYFNSGGASSGSTKSGTNKVRCVREI